MANIPDYCRRKHGEEWQAPHPELDDILSETYGIMVYQEQVMQIAQKMAGYSLGNADLLRRAMGKKIRAEMEAQRETFVRGATARGVTPAKATEVFELMAKFADYGFNKSHAAAYALVAYQTAWMKANHAEVFIAACMSLALGNTERLAALREEAARSGIRILPPDINRSNADFTVERADEGLAIRYALAAIKKVGFAAMQALTDVRGHAPFADLADFAARVDPRQLNRMQLENLIRAGAFDALGPNRARMFAAVETILRRAQAIAAEKASGQITLFGTTSGAPIEPLRLPDMPDWPPIDRLNFEAEAIGFHLTAHPLDAYAKALRRLGTTPCARIEASVQSGVTRVRLAGMVAAQKERVTRTGNRMAWVRITDASGSCEVTLFAEVLARARDLLGNGMNLLITAELRQDGEATRITAQDVTSLDQAAAAVGSAMRIWLRETAAVPHIRDLLGREGPGKGRVILVPRIGTTQSVEIALPGGFNVTPRLAQAMKVLPGVEQVEEL
jgi:DNA polymerase-3 subunit alpha